MSEKAQVVVSRHPSGYWIGVAAVPLSGCIPQTEAGALPVGHGDFRKNIMVYEILDERPIMRQVLKEMVTKAKKQGVFVGGIFGNIWKKIKKAAKGVVRKIAKIGIVKKIGRAIKKIAKVAGPILKAVGPILLNVATAIPVVGPAIRATKEAVGAAINTVKKAKKGVEKTLNGVKKMAEKAALGDPRSKYALNMVKQVKRKMGKYQKAHGRMKPSPGRKAALIVPPMRRIKPPKPLPKLPRLPPEPKAPAMDASPTDWTVYVQMVEKWEKAKKGHKKLYNKKKKYSRGRRRRAIVHASVKRMSGKQIFAAL